MLLFNSFQLSQISQKMERITEFLFPQQSQVEWKSDCEKSLNGYGAVFIYLPTCHHCQKMKPLVEEAEIKFYWVNPQNSKCANLNLTEFNFQGFVPHFYCLKTKDSHTGELPKEQFDAWVNNCK